MNEHRREIMQNVFLTYLPARKFKTSCLSVQLVSQLDSATASANALTPAVLHRGTMTYPDMEQLSAAMDRTWALTWRQWHGTDVLENKMIVTVAVTVVTVFLLVCAYSPSYLGWSFPLHNIQAVGKAVRAMRLWALAGITTTVISLAGWGTMKPGLIVFLGCGLVLKAIATIIEIKEKDKKEDPQ